MSHHIYRTEAFVIRQENVGEFDKNIIFYSRKLGLVRARAQSVRRPTSKLKSVYFETNHLDASFLKGRVFWRITTSKFLPDQITETENKEKTRAFLRILILLERLVEQEVPDEKIFENLLDAKNKILENKKPENEIEIETVSQILSHLGYINQREIENLDINKDKNKIIQNINKAIKESQL